VPGNISLSWINPTVNFGGVIIKRKAGSFPAAYNDESASTVYTGIDTTYLDNTGLTNNNT
jgi:hypothetical protein